MGTPHQRLTSSDALFSKTQQAVLGLLFTHVDESFHLREIVRRSGIGQGTVQRELKKLTAAGILIRDVRGRQTFFRVNRDYPIYQELHSLAIKTFGIAQKMAEALNDIADRIQVAFIYGSYASGEENGRSDIDLLVIGNLDLREIVKALGGVQQVLGREINPTIYQPEEYRRRLAEGSHFLTALREALKIFLVGNEDDLSRLG